MLDGLYNLFAQMGFGDPIHPPITHMPIGLAVGAFVFILIAVIFKKKNLEITVRHVSILTFIFAFPTILLGVLDWIHFYHAVLFTPIVIKMTLAAVLLIELAIGIILGSEVKMRSFLMTLLASVGFVAVIGLGFFGSGIMYGRGVTMANAPVTTPAPTASPAASPAVSPSASPASAALVAAGETIFSDECAACHANGGNSLRPDLPVKTSKKIASSSDFIAFIRAPKLPNGQKGAMPAFTTDDLSDRDAAALYAFVKAKNAGGWK